MSFEHMFESPIPLREAADFFLKLKYASGLPPETEELEEKEASPGGISLPATATGLQKPVEHMPQLQGTAAGQQAKIAFRKAAKKYSQKEKNYIEASAGGGGVMGGLIGGLYAGGALSRAVERSAPANPFVVVGSGIAGAYAGARAGNVVGSFLGRASAENTLERIDRLGKIKAGAGQSLDPETMSYLQQEQDAEQAVGEAEEGYYRQRFAEAAQELQATQAQLQEQQAHIQTLEEQAGQQLQQSEGVLQQAQETNAMATETAMQAHGVAAQAIQQNQLQSQELIQQMQLSANMRAALDEMKQQVMQVAMQPSPPTTTVQQAFDMTAGPGGPGGEMGDPLQDPAMGGEPGMPVDAPVEAPAPVPANKPAPKKPEEKMANANLVGGLAGGAALGVGVSRLLKKLQRNTTAAPVNNPAVKAASARLIGGLAGAAVGGGATYLESKSDPKKMQDKIRALEKQRAEGGGFGTSLNLAKSRIQEALTDVARHSPVKATMAGTVIGAAQGAALGPALVQLSHSVKNFGKKAPAPSAFMR